MSDKELAHQMELLRQEFRCAHDKLNCAIETVDQRNTEQHDVIRANTEATMKSFMRILMWASAFVSIMAVAALAIRFI